MPNNTPTYWEAAGVSLHTYAQSIETLSGLGPPKLRGENVVVPLHPGSRFIQKVPDSNTLTLAMWLRGVVSSAGVAEVNETREQYMRNWNDLVRLMWRNGEQFDLTKRFYDGTNPSVISATAKAEYAGGLEPTFLGKSAAKCTIDLTLADPFFYSDSLFSASLVNGNNMIDVPGTAESLAIFIRINGSRTNTTIRNVTNGIEFTYPNAVASTEYLDVDVKNYTARHKPAGGPEYDASTRIIHFGGPQWLKLEPGANTLNVSSTSGTGVITIQARGAWV